MTDPQGTSQEAELGPKSSTDERTSTEEASVDVNQEAAKKGVEEAERKGLIADYQIGEKSGAPITRHAWMEFNNSSPRSRWWHCRCKPKSEGGVAPHWYTCYPHEPAVPGQPGLARNSAGGPATAKHLRSGKRSASCRGMSRTTNSSLPVRALPPGPPLPALLQAGLIRPDPIPFVHACHRRYGDRFTIRIPGIGTLVFLTDPDDIKSVAHGEPTDLPGGGGGRAARRSSRVAIADQTRRRRAPAQPQDAAAGVSR